MARPMTTEASQRLSGRARALALQITAEARAEWAYTSAVIATAFRSNRNLGSSERRQIAGTVYGLVRWDRRLEAIADEALELAGRRGSREAMSPGARDEL